MVDHTVGRMLDLFDIDLGTVERWREDDGKKPPILRPVAGSKQGG